MPPVANGAEWLNDPEGTQPRANVSCASIGNWYKTMETAGFTDLSYFNVNEFGLNIILPQGMPLAPSLNNASASPMCADTWMNASACLGATFPDAVVTHSFSTMSGGVASGPLYSWQDAVVVDPGVASYHAFILEQVRVGVCLFGVVAAHLFAQLRKQGFVLPLILVFILQLVRHVTCEDGFAGVIIDRSDWMVRRNWVRKSVLEWRDTPC